jgi:hypothetical protein
MKMQIRHPYEYSEFGGNSKSGWRFNGKKLSRDWVYVWAVKNPKTGKVALVMSDCHSGAPTRVEPIETWHNRDRLRSLEGYTDAPDPPDDGEKWRLLCSLVDCGQIRITEKNYGVIDSGRLNVLMEQLTDD